MDLFDFMNGLSPWWWVAIAIVLGIIEVLTFSFFLIWPGLAALAMGALLWIAPDMKGSMQVLIFAILSVLFTIAGRYWIVNRKPTDGRPQLNNRASALIGERAVVITGFESGRAGTVEVNGIRWSARMPGASATPAAGDVFDIVDADGMVLVLGPRS